MFLKTTQIQKYFFPFPFNKQKKRKNIEIEKEKTLFPLLAMVAKLKF